MRYAIVLCFLFLGGCEAMQAISQAESAFRALLAIEQADRDADD